MSGSGRSFDVYGTSCKRLAILDDWIIAEDIPAAFKILCLARLPVATLIAIRHSLSRPAW